LYLLLKKKKIEEIKIKKVIIIKNFFSIIIEESIKIIINERKAALSPENIIEIAKNDNIKKRIIFFLK